MIGRAYIHILSAHLGPSKLLKKRKMKNNFLLWCFVVVFVLLFRFEWIALTSPYRPIHTNTQTQGKAYQSGKMMDANPICSLKNKTWANICVCVCVCAGAPLCYCYYTIVVAGVTSFFSCSLGFVFPIASPPETKDDIHLSIHYVYVFIHFNRYII